MAFLFEEINAIKRQLNPAKTVAFKKRKVESLLSTEINLTISSDEDEEYFVTSPNFFRPSKPKLAKTSHPTSELVVSPTVNQEEHLLRAHADTGASSNIILEAYTSRHLIKMMMRSKPPGVPWVVSSLLINLDL